MSAFEAHRELDGLPTPRRYWASAAILLAISMSVLDSSIANVALPSIARELHATNAAAVWVINAYQVAILIGLLPLAALGESIGYRRVSQAGLAVFTLASLACTGAHSLAALSIARIVQGLGAAGIMSVNAALVRFTYPQRMLGRAIGINAFVIGTSAAIGPTVASAILSVGHWRWLFAINGPIGLVTLLLASAALPVIAPSRRPLDRTAVLLNGGGLGLLVGGLQACAHREATWIAVAQLAAGAGLLWLLVRRERHAEAPLVPLDLLRIRLFALSIATSVCSFAAQATAFVALPFELERLGRSPAETGFLLTPWPAAVALAAPLAGRLADRHSASVLGGAGLAALALGLALLANVGGAGGTLDLLWLMALCGAGFGFFQSPNNRTLLAAAPRERSGAAGGMLGTARLLGQSLGAACVALLFRVDGAGGGHLALLLATALAMVAALISLSRGGLARRGA